MGIRGFWGIRRESAKGTEDRLAVSTAIPKFCFGRVGKLSRRSLHPEFPIGHNTVS
jgi:hypothetical protein